jgi:hypothetical protein
MALVDISLRGVGDRLTVGGDGRPSPFALGVLEDLDVVLGEALGVLVVRHYASGPS